MPSIKLIALFLASFLSIMAVLQAISHLVREKQKEYDNKQSQIILENVEQRFKLFLNLSVAVGSMGAEYFSSGDLLTKDYGLLGSSFLKWRNDFLGINILDKDGKIVRVFPEDANIKALGHISQNIQYLKRSYEITENPWLSPPFTLFQGEKGFALYFPITENKKIKGWLATVVSARLLTEEFRLQEFLNLYHVVINDIDSNLSFYETALLPNEKNLYSKTIIIFGRKIKLTTWRKDPAFLQLLPFTWLVMASLFFSMLVVLACMFYEQRKKARHQLREISILLKLSSKEAIIKLIDLQAEFYKIGSSENAQYVASLIEQIDLLQMTASYRKDLPQEIKKFLPLLREELLDLNEFQEKKAVAIHYDQESLEKVSINSNEWLFKNCVLKNILLYAILHSDPNSDINISYQLINHKQIFTVSAKCLVHMSLKTNDDYMDRRMKMARMVLEMFGGSLSYEQLPTGSLHIQFSLPMVK